MRVLVVFLLGISLAEGILVHKCDLKEKVMAAIGPLMDERGRQGRLTVEDTVAKIVCHAELASGFNTSAVNELNPSCKKPSSRSSPNSEEVWTLYGLFQLSNHLVCSDDDETDLSETICKMDCSQLMDDTIDDDVKCLRTIVAKLLKEGWKNRKLIKMIKLIFEERCGDKRAAEYFSDCL